MRYFRTLSIWGIAAAMLGLILVGTAQAENYSLCTGATSITMPDGTVVPAWGFGIDPGSGPCPATVPGPELTVSPGQGLTINLRNTLDEPVSLHIVGQSPDDGGAPVVPDGRVMSFNKETPADGSTVVAYSWSNLAPGTHLLMDGTDPAKHVQMGLFAAVVKDFAAGVAYPGVNYDSSKVLLYHDVDPEMQAAIAAGDYGAEDSTFPSAVHRKARYYLINGAAYPDIPNPIHSAATGDAVLLRFLNAGYQTYVPQILGTYMNTVAEDGLPLAYAKEAYNFEMPSLKTVDALVVMNDAGPVEGKYPIYDGRLHLSNMGSYAGAPAGGGMIAYLAASGGVAVTAVDDNYATDQNVALNIAAPGVLANDSGPGALSAVLAAGPANGVLNLNADGSFDYTPNSGFSGADSFTYDADYNGTTDQAVVNITVNTVNAVPVAANDSAVTDQDTPVGINVLANDNDPDAGPQPLSVNIQSAPANGGVVVNVDNTVTYTPNGGYFGADSFTYTAFDGAADSNTATVNVTVNEVPPANEPPIAVDDAASMGARQPAVNVDVLANDSDPEGGPLTIVNLTQPANGRASIALDGTILYRPNRGFTGTDTFTYRVQDDQGALSLRQVTPGGVSTDEPTVVTITRN